MIHNGKFPSREKTGLISVTRGVEGGVSSFCNLGKCSVKAPVREGEKIRSQRERAGTRVCLKMMTATTVDVCHTED